MQFTRFRQLASAVGLTAGVLGTGALAQQAAPAQPRKVVVENEDREVHLFLVEGEDAPGAPQTRRIEKFKVRSTRDGETRDGETRDGETRDGETGYWIGLQLDPPSDALRSQLGIAAEQGLVVTELFPDTPAVKAGFAKHDVIVKLGDEPSSSIEKFNEIVQGTKGEKELAVTVIRGGKQEVIKVTPAKRPGENAFTLRVAPQPGEQDLLLEWMPKGLDPEHPMRVEFFNPGLVVGKPGDAKVGDLPKNMSISISKAGDAPAKISVSKDEEKWEITEKELDKLPPEVREHVERMLRPGPWEARALHVRPRIEFAPHRIVTPYPPAAAGAAKVVPPAVAPPVAIPPVPAIPAAPSDVDKRLDEVNARLEQLQKALEALTRQHEEQAKQ
jgi:membrane-associated protease RseP (regulator of RpoE activity)